ncbi:unnamed protein product [Calypogeia fissa]
MRTQMSLLALVLLISCCCCISSTRAQICRSNLTLSCGSPNNAMYTADIISFTQSLTTTYGSFSLGANGSTTLIEHNTAAFCLINVNTQPDNITASDIADGGLAIANLCCAGSTFCAGGIYLFYGPLEARSLLSVQYANLTCGLL